MKKLIAFVLLFVSALMLGSCDVTTDSNNQNNEQTNDQAGNNSNNQTGNDSNNQTGNDQNENNNNEGNTGNQNNNNQGSQTGPVVLTDTTIYVVGDSTVCDYSKGEGVMTDDTYYYPRYGYATQLYNYIDAKASVVNLALSGRSSKSFLSEANYQTLKTNIKEGDYLLIGFGHNDEKNTTPEDLELRFTDASKPTTDSTSFKYHLYEYYIKLCETVGATPILCTPIVRLDTNDAYTGSKVHDCTSSGIGDYRQAIIDLGAEKNVTVIDLTTFTKNLYTELGYNEARYLHAMPSQYKDGEIVPALAGVDQTHINVYGAKVISYEIATQLKASTNKLGNYVKADITKPTKANDLVKWKNAYAVAYSSPNMSSYTPADHFTCLSEGWYGTAFGNTGGDPQSSGNGYVAKETTTGVFKVGQYADKDGAANPKGKIQTADDTMSFVFKQVSINDNFTLTAKAKVLTTASTKQAGFGLVLRDDVYLNQTEKNIAGINSNYVTAGMLVNNDSTTANVLFYRETKSLKKGEANVAAYAVGDTAELSITRAGQLVITTVVYKGQTYTQTYTDFDFTSVDQNYFYVGMFAVRGTTIEYTDVVYTYTGVSQGA